MLEGFEFPYVFFPEGNFTYLLSVSSRYNKALFLFLFNVFMQFTICKVINQIHKARKTLSRSHGKFPADDEIAKFTGLSTARIAMASKCLRVVGSIDQKVGDCISAKVLVKISVLFFSFKEACLYLLILDVMI